MACKYKKFTKVCLHKQKYACTIPNFYASDSFNSHEIYVRY